MNLVMELCLWYVSRVVCCVFMCFYERRFLRVERFFFMCFELNMIMIRIFDDFYECFNFRLCLDVFVFFIILGY